MQDANAFADEEDAGTPKSVKPQFPVRAQVGGFHSSTSSPPISDSAGLRSRKMPFVAETCAKLCNECPRAFTCICCSALALAARPLVSASCSRGCLALPVKGSGDCVPCSTAWA